MKLVKFLLFMLAATPALAADLYKWQDASGRTRYTDQPPPPTAKNVQKLKTSSARLAAETAAITAQPFESKQAAEKYPVVLFSFEDCDPCRSAENFLDKRGIPYTLKNQDADKTELKQISGGLSVPVMLVGKEMRKGFEAGAWDKLLYAAGYAKQNPYAKPGKTKTATTSASETPVASTPAASQ